MPRDINDNQPGGLTKNHEKAAQAPEPRTKSDQLVSEQYGAGQYAHAKANGWHFPCS